VGMTVEHANPGAHSVRAAAFADLPQLVEMVALLYQEEHLQFHAEQCQLALQSLLNQVQLGFILVGTVHSRLVAYSAVTYGYSIEFGGRFALLDEIFVAPTHRGCGLGTALLAHVVAECNKHGLDSIRLEVECQNERAQHLYQRLGFVQHDRKLMTRWLVARA
jgi:ribosomal protein S18 acetylase RimI-like enzyme